MHRVQYASASLWLSGPYWPLSLQSQPKGNACLITPMCWLLSLMTPTLFWWSKFQVCYELFSFLPPLLWVQAPTTSPVNYDDGFLTGPTVSVFPFFNPLCALLAAHSSGSMLPNITVCLGLNSLAKHSKSPMVQLQPTLLQLKPLYTLSALWAPVRPQHTLFFYSPEAFLLPWIFSLFFYLECSLLHLCTLTFYQ